MKIEVEKILTEAEFSDLFDKDKDDEAPGWVDDNEKEWVAFFYKKGYRLVKLP